MTTAYIVLAIGSGLLTLFTLLIAWTKIRVVRLKADLLELRCDFRSAICTLDAKDVARVRELDETISNVIKSAGMLTTSGFMYTVLTSNDERDRDPFGDLSDIANLELRKLIRHTMNRLVLRVLMFLMLECASGVATSIVVLATMGTLQRIRVITRSTDLVWSTFGPRMHPA